MSKIASKSSPNILSSSKQKMFLKNDPQWFMPHAKFQHKPRISMSTDSVSRIPFRFL